MAVNVILKEEILDGNPIVLRFLMNQGTSFFTKDKVK
jgi:hypothetical protein